MKYPKFAREVARLRSYRDKTLYEVAEYVKVSHTYISQIENGKKLPSLKVLFPLTYFLNTENYSGYVNKKEDTADESNRLLEVYSEYKSLDKEKVFKDYMNYVDNLLKEDMSDSFEITNAIQNNEISMNPNTAEIKKIDNPYFDLEWLLNQKESNIFYGTDYDIQGCLDKNSKINYGDFYNILKDEDIKIIRGIVKAYIASKYKKISDNDIGM